MSIQYEIVEIQIDSEYVLWKKKNLFSFFYAPMRLLLLLFGWNEKLVQQKQLEHITHNGNWVNVAMNDSLLKRIKSIYWIKWWISVLSICATHSFEIIITYKLHFCLWISWHLIHICVYVAFSCSISVLLAYAVDK